MTANKQSYSAPFDPRVPPVFPASVINDEFRQQNPSISAAGALRQYVALESKWTKFEPGEILLAGTFIDPIRQMAFISGSAPKAWQGIMQDLPVPAIGETVNYRLVVRMLNGACQVGPNTDYGPVYWGLILGEAMREDPLLTRLYGVAAEQSRFSGETVGQTVVAEFTTFDSPFVPDATLALPLDYMMATVFTSRSGEDEWSTNLTFSASADGIFFKPLFSYLAMPNPLRQFACAQNSTPDGELTNMGMLTAVDFVRFYPVGAEPDDLDPLVGEVLQLGSV